MARERRSFLLVQNHVENLRRLYFHSYQYISNIMVEMLRWEMFDDETAWTWFCSVDAFYYLCDRVFTSASELSMTSWSEREDLKSRLRSDQRFYVRWSTEGRGLWGHRWKTLLAQDNDLRDRPGLWFQAGYNFIGNPRFNPDQIQFESLRHAIGAQFRKLEIQERRAGLIYEGAQRSEAAGQSQVAVATELSRHTDEPAAVIVDPLANIRGGELRSCTVWP